MRKFSLVFYLISCFLTGCYAETNRETKAKRDIMSQSIDTSHWETHCIGQYFIDLPSGATGGDGETFIQGSKISWVKTIKTREQLFLRIKEEETKELTWIRDDGKPYFIKRINYANNKGFGILTYSTGSDNPIAYSLNNFFMADNPFRVFQYPVGKIYDHNIDEKLKFSAGLSQAIQSFNPMSPPREEGLCINGGFIAGKYASEDTWAHFYYPYYSDDYYLMIGIISDVRTKKITRSLKSDTVAPVRKGHKVFRDRWISFNGIKGEEYSVKNSGDDDIPYPFTNYVLEWEIKGEPQDFNNPRVHIIMQVLEKDHKVYMTKSNQYPQFANDEMALKYWDTILGTIRKR